MSNLIHSNQLLYPLSGSFTGDVKSRYELFVYNFSDDNYIGTDGNISAIKSTSNFQPNLGDIDESWINNIIGRVYIDIFDYRTSSSYLNQTFGTLGELNNFLTDHSIISGGRLIFYAYKNNTETLKVGGINYFYSQISYNGKTGKIQSKGKKQFYVDFNKPFYQSLRSYFHGGDFVGQCNAVLPNFADNYLSQNQADNIARDNLFKFIKINKYNKRHMSKFYVGEVEGVDINGNRDYTVSRNNKVIAFAVCSIDLGGNIQLVTLNTSYRYDLSHFKWNWLFSTNEFSYFYIYIIETENGNRAVAIDPISIDRLVIPLSSTSPAINGDGGLDQSYTFLMKKGNKILQYIPDPYITDNALYNDIVPLNNQNYWNIPNNGRSFQEGHQNQVTIVRAYSNRTCDVFEECARIEHTKFNNSILSYFKLNPNSP